VLVLSRKLDEEIFIGETKIKVVEINKGSIKLGIEAPKQMQILRGELKKAIEDTNKEANHKADANELSSLSKLLKK
jgi:carbon storage regulator